MRFIILFCFYSSLGFSQATLFDSIPLNSNFYTVGFTEAQKRWIENEYRAIQASDQYPRDEDSFLSLNRAIQLYAYAQLGEDQKARYVQAWKTSTWNALHSWYRHLQLSDQQKEELIRRYEARPGADTLKIISHDPRIPLDIILSVLDSSQLRLQAEHENQVRLNRESAIAEAETEKARDTAFERQRLSLIEVYSKRHLQKAKGKLVNKISKIRTEDVSRLHQITSMYQTRVDWARLQGAERFYSQDSVLFAPVQLKLMNFQYDGFTWQPNLSVYWWSRDKNDAEVKAEGKKVITELEYFKETYGDLISKYLLTLKKHETKLEARIEAIRPPREARTSVNIVADPRTKAVEDVAKLLLVRI